MGTLTREAFTRFLEREPRSVLGLTRILARWLALSNQRRIRADKQGRGDVAVYLKPSVAAFVTFDMKSIDSIVEAGYHYAMGKLEGGENLWGTDSAG